ncbi:MAG: HlyC/CorC family transporter, partial [Acholeplasmataceae bacterium]|nr:HlyC/CorC family transporter [Acholeplasmataceae bacterium]
SILIILFLIVLSALLIAGEVAMVEVSDQFVNHDASDGNKRAIKIQKFTKEPKIITTSILILVSLFTIINGAIALDTFHNEVLLWFNISHVLIDILAIIIIALILLVFQVLFGQLIPRRLASKHAKKLSYGLVGFVFFISNLIKPITCTLLYLTKIVGILFGLDPNEVDRNMTEEEIRTIVEASSKTGIIDEDEREMIHNIFEFDDTTVDEIMTHRTEISALNIDASKDEIIEFVTHEKFTRFPVYRDSLDHVMGTLHVKDLLKYIGTNTESFEIKELIRDPYFIPDSKKISELFKEMQKQKNHIAIVIDEYGGTAGIVTIEDLIEEIVGNIFDEYDEVEEEIVTLNEDIYEIEGLTNIDDVEDAIHAKLPVEEYDTLSGFILGFLGRFPDDGEAVSFEYNKFRFEILNYDDKVITRVRVTRLEPTNDDELEDE